MELIEIANGNHRLVKRGLKQGFNSTELPAMGYLMHQAFELLLRSRSGTTEDTHDLKEHLAILSAKRALTGQEKSIIPRAHVYNNWYVQCTSTATKVEILEAIRLYEEVRG